MNIIKEFERNVINCSTGKEIIETYLLKEDVLGLIDEEIKRFEHPKNMVSKAMVMYLQGLKARIEGYHLKAKAY